MKNIVLFLSVFLLNKGFFLHSMQIDDLGKCHIFHIDQNNSLTKSQVNIKKKEGCCFYNSVKFRGHTCTDRYLTVTLPKNMKVSIGTIKGLAKQDFYNDTRLKLMQKPKNNFNKDEWYKKTALIENLFISVIKEINPAYPKENIPTLPYQPNLEKIKNLLVLLYEKTGTLNQKTFFSSYQTIPWKIVQAARAVCKQIKELPIDHQESAKIDLDGTISPLFSLLFQVDPKLKDTFNTTNLINPSSSKALFLENIISCGLPLTICTLIKIGLKIYNTTLFGSIFPAIGSYNSSIPYETQCLNELLSQIKIIPSWLMHEWQSSTKKTNPDYNQNAQQKKCWYRIQLLLDESYYPED